MNHIFSNEFWPLGYIGIHCDTLIQEANRTQEVEISGTFGRMTFGNNHSYYLKSMIAIVVIIEIMVMMNEVSSMSAGQRRW